MLILPQPGETKEEFLKRAAEAAALVGMKGLKPIKKPKSEEKNGNS